MAHDPQKIINTANSFLLAADRALEQRPLGPAQFQMLLVPAVVSTAFAVELYFKAIITLEKGSKKWGLAIIHLRSARVIEYLTSSLQADVRD